MAGLHRVNEREVNRRAGLFISASCVGASLKPR